MNIPDTPFYERKLKGRRPTSLTEFPFTTKTDLVADQAANPPYGTNLAQPLSKYTRLHQTSGTTTGQPLRWLDTPRNWEWMLGCWDDIYRRAGIGAGDRAFFAFSFGPFLGFWTAFESALRTGMYCISGGGMSSAARLQTMATNRINVLLCTPTYALHLAATATALPKIDTLLLAGEPGALVPAIRSRLETAWSARVIDHYGLTEVGPVAVEEDGALVVSNDRYIAEVIDPVTQQPTTDGELVLTNLGRVDSPLVRYRTGDLVRRVGNRLVGGILGRVDDMIQIRGNNVYPSAIEAIIRRFPEVAEFRVEVDARQPLAQVDIAIEATDVGVVPRLANVIQDELLFRAAVVVVPPGSLPRSEMKSKRFIRKKESS